MVALAIVGASLPQAQRVLESGYSTKVIPDDFNPKIDNSAGNMHGLCAAPTDAFAAFCC